MRDQRCHAKDREVIALALPHMLANLGDFESGTRAELPAGLPAHIEMNDDPLGQPLGIREIAKLIGCSAWTVRQRYLPQGLPHFRSGPNAKLIFYKNQVIRWLLRQQEKGGSNL